MTPFFVSWDVKHANSQSISTEAPLPWAGLSTTTGAHTGSPVPGQELLGPCFQTFSLKGKACRAASAPRPSAAVPGCLCPLPQRGRAQGA